jgi:signal transduction histidine kinase/integral membrane sensor domain MASE1
MAGLVILLYASGMLAQGAANPAGFACAVWPPAGLGLGLLLHGGARLWPVMFTGVLAINLHTVIAQDFTGTPVRVVFFVLAVAAGSTMSYLAVATYIRRRVGVPVTLVHNRHILVFALWGGIVAPAVTAALGSLLLLMRGVISLDVLGFTWLTWWVGDGIGVLIFTPLYLTLAGQRQPLWRQRRRGMLVPFTLAFVLVLVFFVYGHARYTQEQKREIDLVAQRIQRLLAQDLAAEIEFLHVLGEVYAIGDSDDSGPFDRLTAHRLAESRTLVAVLWVPEPTTVANAFRPRWVRAEWPHTLTPNTALTVDEQIPRALARARITGKLAATIVRPRILGQGDTPVLWVFMPVAAPSSLSESGRPSQVRGYFGVALAAHVLVAVLPELARVTDTHVWLEDTAATELDVLPSLSPSAPRSDELSDYARNLMSVRTIQVADRTWRLHVAPTEAYQTGADSLALWLSLVSGLAFSGMLGILLLSFSARHAAIAAEVAERTAALSQAKQRLEDEVAERERAQASLARAAIAAEAASQAKSRFLNNMSHEIRTPMNAVIGMTELLTDTTLDAEQRDYVEVVREAGIALLAMVDDVLDVARIESGRMWLDVAPFQLRATAESVCALFGARARDHGLDLTLRVADDVPDALLGDGGRLRQVLSNLVGNAIKFTERGHVSASVALHAGEPEQEHGVVELCFRVKDTGIGIPEDKRELIFHAFEQADTSLSRRYGGTGLGLAIAAELVQLMGGRIWVESEVGNGSAFAFTARFRLAGQAQADPAPAA